VGEARALARSARKGARRKRVSVALVERLERELGAAEQVLAQTTCAWPGSARSPTGASRSSTPTRVRSGSAARCGRPSLLQGPHR
jgi:hypothetical protein